MLLKKVIFLLQVLEQYFIRSLAFERGGRAFASAGENCSPVVANSAFRPYAKPAKKTKKPAAKKPSHPPYEEMVLKTLKDGKKSLAAIRKGVCAIIGSGNTARNSNYVRNAVKKL